MSWDYEFTLPYPPSVNAMWRAFRGRMILSKRGREYRKHALDVMSWNELQGENLKGRLELSLVLNPPTLRKYDCDNYLKAVLDVLTHSEFWVDDEQVDKIIVEKGEKIKDGKVVVKVRGI